MERRDSGLGIRGWGRRAGCWGVIAVLAISAAGGMGFGKQKADEETLAIELLVYDYARVESKEMARAREEASRLLELVGIRTAWRDCPVAAVTPQESQDCRSAVSALVLRILPRTMAERMARGAGSLGFSQLGDDGTPGFVASVFYHRVESLAAELACPRAVILGYALAHEIGHLLLGTNSHTPHGIMCAQWTEKELRSASAGRFGFFPQQAAKMRVDAGRRMKLRAPLVEPAN